METSDSNSLGHKPSGKWVFDEQVTACFDDMLRRSIPCYEQMRHAVYNVATPHVRKGSHIVDIGCSRGEALAPFVSRYGMDCRYIGIEVSKPMLTAARERFAGQIEHGTVQILEHDLRRGYPQRIRASVTLAILTIQFTPIEYRLRIVRDIYRATRPGGVLIMVEKVLGASADLDDQMVSLYYAQKAENGYTQEEIIRKRMALEGVLVPVTAAWNEDLLRMSGFNQVDCFWRYLNFAGWIAVKGRW